MVECCKTCGSMIISGYCSNKNCQDKLDIVNNIMNKFFEECSEGFICSRNGTGCTYVNKKKKDS